MGQIKLWKTVDNPFLRGVLRGVFDGFRGQLLVTFSIDARANFRQPRLRPREGCCDPPGVPPGYLPIGEYFRVKRLSSRDVSGGDWIDRFHGRRV